MSGIQPRVPRRTLSRRPALLKLTAAILRFIAPDKPMNMVSDQIQEPEPVAEAEEPEIVACSITDGSQAIAHDGFDVETYSR
jgi:hypothetical protein